MTFEVRVVDSSGNRLGEGTAFELLGDGAVLGKATPSAQGTVTFETDTSGVTTLAVRAVHE